MKKYLYTTAISLVSVVAIMTCMSLRNVDSKQRDDERPRSSATGQSQTASDEHFQPLNVSIIRLIADPEAYDGKLVRVTGLVAIRFEGTAVYLNYADYRRFISKNAIWLDLGSADRGTYRNIDGKYTYIEGIFKAKYNGHLNRYSGAIVKITRLDPLP